MATFHSWWKNLLKTLLPLRRTSQDEFLDESIRLAAQSDKAVILTAPRGIQKSFCALRRAHRVNIFIRKVVLIRAEKNDDGKSLAKFYSLTGPTLSQQLKWAVVGMLGPLGVAFVCFIIYLLWDPFGEKKDGQPTKIWEQFKHKILKATPTINDYIYAALCIFLSICSACRRRAIIYDDPLIAVPKQATSTRQLQRETLDSIRARGQDYPVVILSSNEGLEKCFDDRAPKLHMHMTFPYAQPTEFVTALKAAVEEKHKNTQLTEGEREELKRLVEGLTEQQLKELLNTIPKRYIKGAYHMLYDILIIQCGGIHTLYVFFFYILRAFYL